MVADRLLGAGEECKGEELSPHVISQVDNGQSTEYAECQAFSTVVLIGFPRKRVLPPPLGLRGDTLACGAFFM